MTVLKKRIIHGKNTGAARRPKCLTYEQKQRLARWGFDELRRSKAYEAIPPHAAEVRGAEQRGTEGEK